MMKPKKIEVMFLLGQYGSGKDTHGPWIAEQFGLQHLSFSTLLSEDSIAHDYLARAELVPDNHVFTIINRHLLNGCLINGFPRTLPQIHFILKRYTIFEVALVFLDVDDDVVIQRMQNRLVCSVCKTATSKLKGHLLGDPCKDSTCSGILQQRVTDTPENIKKRMESFRKDTLPVIHQAKNSHINVYEITVQKEQSIEATQAMLAHVLRL